MRCGGGIHGGNIPRSGTWGGFFLILALTNRARDIPIINDCLGTFFLPSCSIKQVVFVPRYTSRLPDGTVISSTGPIIKITACDIHHHIHILQPSASGTKSQGKTVGFDPLH